MRRRAVLSVFAVAGQRFFSAAFLAFLGAQLIILAGATILGRFVLLALLLRAGLLFACTAGGGF
jgi:hypothetical protein